MLVANQQMGWVGISGGEWAHWWRTCGIRRMGETTFNKEEVEENQTYLRM